MSNVEVIGSASEPVNKLLTPLASSAGKTLQDVWELVFGGFSNYVEKKRITRLRALEDFKKSLEDKVSAIPDDQLCEPNLAIVGPALDSAKYYFEDPDIREMFAKLISASMDNQKSPVVHPSFAEIIKQMSPLDAQNLALFAGDLPVSEYRSVGDGGVYNVLISNVFLENTRITDLRLQSQSLSSLNRLGLIDISFDQWINNDGLYKKFQETPQYEAYKRTVPDHGNRTLMAQKGIAYLTPIGKAFRSICLD